ncbi:MAG: molybdopterin-dependent oxidoreductase, partial [Acidobacteriota bacterium]
MNRRQSLAVLGAGGLALVGYRIVGGGGMTARGLRWPVGATPEITPTEDFYQVSKNFLFADPQLDVASWRLDVRGRLARPLSLSLQDLRAMPAVEQPATLACIGNSVPARAIGNAMWTGVRLATVLEAAGLETDRLETGGGEAASGDAARRFDVVFTGADNYTDSIPLHRVLHPGTLLAFDMNGAPLARGHGAPLRAIVPGIYGMKNVKWIEAIEIVSGDYLGYWQQRGWSEAAPYQTLSRIDQPRDGDRLSGGGPHRITGVAFSGDRGISALEVLIG